MKHSFADLPIDLIRSVIEAPHRDEPRLRVADWLDGHNDSWGTYIRISLELRQLRRRGDPAWLEVHHRVDALADRHSTGLDWYGPGRAYDQPGRPSVSDHPSLIGGFMESLELSAERFLADAATIVTSTPLRHLLLWGVELPHVHELASCEHVGQLVSLELRGPWIDEKNHYWNVVDDTAIEALASSPHVAGLKYLGAWGPTTDRAAELVAESSYLRELQVAKIKTDRPVLQDEDEYELKENMGQRMRPELATVQPYARELERQHGYRAWFHHLSNSPFYPREPSRFDF